MSATWNVTIPPSEITDAMVSASAAIARAKLAQRVNAVCPVNPTDWRTWDALATNLPGTPANDDLGLVTGTFGSTPAPYVGTGDVKATSSTRRACAFVRIPEDYETGQTLTLRAWAGMTTTIADGSCTLDFEAYRIDLDGTYGAADLISTAAQSINALVAAAKTFTISDSTISPGDLLLVRMSIAYVDAATATAVIGSVWGVELLADLR